MIGKGENNMNSYQMEFSEFWEKVANTLFYKVVKITEKSNFSDMILDNQRKKVSSCIQDEIKRTFFDSELRPRATVWLEDLQKSFPDEAERLKKSLKSCEISSKGYENIITIAAGGTTAIAGAAIAKKNPIVSSLMILGGVVAAGYKLASGLSVDTEVLQKEVKKQFEVWKAPMMNILASCNDADSV